MTEKEIKQLAEIKKFPHRIVSIEAPCEEIQIEAVTRHPELIQDIIKPTPLACKIAVEKFFGIQITDNITEDFIKETMTLFFLLTDIDTIYDSNELPDSNLLCDEYNEYDDKKFFLSNIGPADTYQQTRQRVFDSFFKAIKFPLEKEQNPIPLTTDNEINKEEDDCKR